LSGNSSDLDSLIAKNGILLNPAKSQVILEANSPPELPLPLLFLGDILLEWKDFVTDLGRFIDCRLRFGRHVTKI
jgi:hypothetical protein